MTAIGSFTPDSSSSTCATRRRTWIRAPRRTEKTAAASVDETIAPKRAASGQGRPTARAASAAKSAVRATPAVARTAAGARTRRTLANGVESPPS